MKDYTRTRLTRCYEREHYSGIESTYNHCGSHVTLNGVDYCTVKGILAGYGNARCGGSRPPDYGEQIKFEV